MRRKFKKIETTMSVADRIDGRLQVMGNGLVRLVTS